MPSQAGHRDKPSDGGNQTGPGSFTFLSGMDRTRVPVAANTALATAGAVAAVPSSPIPPHFFATRQCEINLDLRSVSKAHDLVASEVALLDLTILDRDFPIERSREAIDHATLDLCLDDSGIDHMPAIDGSDDAINTHFASRVRRG